MYNVIKVFNILVNFSISVLKSCDLWPIPLISGPRNLGGKRKRKFLRKITNSCPTSNSYIVRHCLTKKGIYICSHCYLCHADWNSYLLFLVCQCFYCQGLLHFVKCFFFIYGDGAFLCSSWDKPLYFVVQSFLCIAGLLLAIILLIFGVCVIWCEYI